jgi:hypothetical protein
MYALTALFQESWLFKTGPDLAPDHVVEPPDELILDSFVHRHM